MRVFTDALGREWQLSITVIEVKRLRESSCGINLLNGIGESSVAFFSELAADPILTVDVLTTLLSEQISESGIDERSFALGMTGEGLANALDALARELASFAGPGRGEVVMASWQTVVAAQQSSNQVAIERLQKTDQGPPPREKTVAGRRWREMLWGKFFKSTSYATCNPDLGRCE